MRDQKFSKPIHLGSLVFVLVLMLSTMVFSPQAQADDDVPNYTAYVTSSRLSIYSGPGYSYRKIDTRYKGQSVSVTHENGNWRRIIWAYDGRYDNIAYVNGNYISKSSQANPRSSQSSPTSFTDNDVDRPNKLAEVTASALNVRSGPSTKYRIIDKLYQGNTALVTHNNGLWRRVSLPGGVSGYVHGNYLVEKATNPTPAPRPSAQEIINAEIHRSLTNPSAEEIIKSEIEADADRKEIAYIASLIKDADSLSTASPSAAKAMYDQARGLLEARNPSLSGVNCNRESPSSNVNNYYITVSSTEKLYRKPHHSCPAKDQFLLPGNGGWVIAEDGDWIYLENTTIGYNGWMPKSASIGSLADITNPDVWIADSDRDWDKDRIKDSIQGDPIMGRGGQYEEEMRASLPDPDLGSIVVENVGEFQLHVPGYRYVNGIDTNEGRHASYRTNWQLEEDDWTTVSMIRDISHIPTTDGWGIAAGVVAGSTGGTLRSTLHPGDYRGAILLPDGSLGVAAENAPELTPQSMLPQAKPPRDSFASYETPTVLTEIHGLRPPPGVPGDLRYSTLQGAISRPHRAPVLQYHLRHQLNHNLRHQRDRTASRADALANGIDMGNNAFNTRHQNYYATQTLLQENNNGDRRAIVIATQINQAGSLNPTGKAEVNSFFISADAEGNLIRTPVVVPTEFIPMNLQEYSDLPPESRRLLDALGVDEDNYQSQHPTAVIRATPAYADIPNYDATHYDYHRDNNLSEIKDSESALSIDELGYTIPD